MWHIITSYLENERKPSFCIALWSPTDGPPFHWPLLQAPPWAAVRAMNNFQLWESISKWAQMQLDCFYRSNTDHSGCGAGMPYKASITWKLRMHVVQRGQEQKDGRECLTQPLWSPLWHDADGISRDSRTALGTIFDCGSGRTIFMRSPATFSTGRTWCIAIDVSKRWSWTWWHFMPICFCFACVFCQYVIQCWWLCCCPSSPQLERVDLHAIMTIAFVSVGSPAGTGTQPHTRLRQSWVLSFERYGIASQHSFSISQRS